MKTELTSLVIFAITVVSFSLLFGWTGWGRIHFMTMMFLIFPGMFALPTFVAYKRWEKSRKMFPQIFPVLFCFLFSFAFCVVTVFFLTRESMIFARHYYWTVNRDKIAQTALTELGGKNGTSYLPITSARFRRSTFVVVAPENGTRFVFFVHGRNGGRDHGFIFQCDQDPEAETFLKSQVWRFRPLSDKWFSYSCFYEVNHPKLQIGKP